MNDLEVTDGDLKAVVPDGACLALTAAGTVTAYGIARSVRESFGAAIRIVGIDTNPPSEVAASHLADAAFVGLPVRDPGYRGELVALFREQEVTLWWPVLDEELVGAEQLAWEMRAGGVAPIVPAQRAATLCLDKLAMAEWLRSENLPTPRTQDARAELSALSRDVIVKPRRGVGSRGVTRVSTREDLVAAVEAAGEDMIVQDVCDLPEVTVDAFRGRNHPVEVAVCRERLQVKAGVCTKARVFHDEQIARLVLELGRSLGLCGAYCVQLMRAVPGGQWTITDVNGRPGAGTRMSVACGFDVHTATLLDLWGRDPAPVLRRLHGERTVVRHYEEDVS